MTQDPESASDVSIFERVKKQVMSWPGVTSQVHRFGGIEFRVSGREMGHMHGSTLADFPLPMSVRDEMVKDGKVSPHHVIPNSGWVSFWIKSDKDIAPLVELFKMQYKRLARNTEPPQIKD